MTYFALCRLIDGAIPYRSCQNTFLYIHKVIKLSGAIFNIFKRVKQRENLNGAIFETNTSE